MQKHMRKLGMILIAIMMVMEAGVEGPWAAAAKKVKPVAPVPQTGQTLRYADGDDGDLRTGVPWPVPRFTNHGNGTVTDNLTGLIWLRNASCAELGPNGDGTALWEPALEAATALASGQCDLTDGSVEGDWRVPNVNELQSLIDWGSSNPALPDGHPFTGVQVYWWSSTPVTVTTHPNFAWYVPLDNGGAGGAHRELDTALVWPVRGSSLAVAAKKVKPVAPVPQTGQWQCWDAADLLIDCADTGQDGDFQAGVAWPVPRFTDHRNGTVTDNLTGRNWLKDASCAELGPNGDGTALWEPALEAATALASGQCDLTDGSVAGDWRLPNINELRSLIDWGSSSPALPDGHPFTGVLSLYWSSTTLTSHPSFAWYVSLPPGNAVANDKGALFVVWPVRGGD